MENRQRRQYEFGCGKSYYDTGGLTKHYRAVHDDQRLKESLEEMVYIAVRIVRRNTHPKKL